MFMSDCAIGENEMARYVRRALGEYFSDLDGEEPGCDLVEMVLAQVGGNQSRAAAMLGINRNTLRKKMMQHGIE
jgi:Fis family transcriptional regulator